MNDLPDVVAIPSYAADVLHEAAARLTAVPGDTGSAQVLHNLRQGLLSQLPRGPVQELRMFAPFVDRTGKALAEVHRDVEVQLLPERFPRHGKLLEWAGPDGRLTPTPRGQATGS